MGCFTKFIYCCRNSVDPVAAIAALIAFVLVFAGFLKHIIDMMFGENRRNRNGDKNKWMIIPLAVLVIIFIYLSLHLPEFISVLINSAALNH